MIRQAEQYPEKIVVASGFEKIGDPIQLNRQRIVNVIASITRQNQEIAISRMNDYADTSVITDADKESLRRELASLERNMEYLITDTRNANLGDSTEYAQVKAAYDKIHDLMEKIVNSVGTYRGTDVALIPAYFQDFTDKATILETKILNTTAENSKINAYYSKTIAGVNIYPEAVPVNTSTTISASLLYEGVEKINEQGVSVNAVSFGLIGLAAGATSSMFTLPSGAEITITELTHSAVITKCKSFQMAYNAIGNSGVNVSVSITLDSDSMPF